MSKSFYDVGDDIFYANSEILAGTVIGVRETHWSDNKFSEITYTVSTPLGHVRNINEEDVKIENKTKIKN